MKKHIQPAGLLVALLLTGCMGGLTNNTPAAPQADAQTPPPAAQPGTAAMTTLGMVRMRRWTSRMCRRPARAASMRARAAATSAS